jgi:hypothetical protein
MEMGGNFSIKEIHVRRAVKEEKLRNEYIRVSECIFH